MKQKKYYQIQNLYKYLKHPEKYVGKKVITMRSGWEIKFVTMFLDKHPAITQWNSEEFVMNYINPFDKRQHRYFIDFYARMTENNGKIADYLFEVKPYNQTIQPKYKTGDKFKTFWINKSKWQAAEKFCENQRKMGKNIYFKLVTEKDFPFLGK